MNNFFQTWKQNTEYFEILQFLASLSGLFSDNVVPYLDYRLAENVFCKFFNAHNEARSCTAYDARLDLLGIGIKTFILKNNQSSEKVAEFNKLRNELDPLSGIDLARKLGYFRNERISFADNSYGTNNRIYHIVGRNEGLLRIFNTTYDYVDIDNIRVTKNDTTGVWFDDGINEYSFNRSKSVLIKKFQVNSGDFVDVPVEILKDPLEVLKELLGKSTTSVQTTILTPTPILKKGVDYVILPLYSERGGRSVPPKSGLNQWNAGGRPRDPNEVYIPIPKAIHNNFPGFFPPRDEHFSLELPNGSTLSAKVCQDGSKALMSTHNADLGEWLLRKVLKKPEGELLTIHDLDRVGIDSVRIINKHKTDYDGRKIYAISFADSYESYSEFSEDEE